MGAQIGLHAALSPLDHLVYLSELEADTLVRRHCVKRPRTESDVSPPTAAELVSVCASPAAADTTASLAAAVDETAAGAQVMVVLMGIPGSGTSPKERRAQWSGSNQGVKPHQEPTVPCLPACMERSAKLCGLARLD